MEKLWQEWSKHYERLGLDPHDICKDGVINTDQFSKNKTKVLYILKESNGFPGGDIRRLFNERPYGIIGKTLARWTAGILNKFPKYSEISQLDDSSLKDYLAKTAIINLKKVSGKSISDYSVINAFAHQDKELLLKQINAIKPDIIISCATMDSLIWLLDLDVNSSKPHEKPIKSKVVSAWVVPSRHPARDNSPKKTYEKLKAMFRHITF